MADEPDRTDRLDVAVYGLVAGAIAWWLRGVWKVLYRPLP